MRRARASATVCGLVLLALAGCSLEPGFDTISGNKRFHCHPDAADGPLDVKFIGREATVTERGEQITLRFGSSIWPRMEGRYEGEGYILTLDPEAFLTRPDGSRLGPCQ